MRTAVNTPGDLKPTDRRRAARAEAAAWIVRLHGPHRSPELESAFRQWLNGDPENGRQFERVTETWEQGASIPVAGIPRLAGRRPPARRRTLIAAAAACVCGISGFIVWFAWPDPTYATAVGEQRIVRLEDGSRLSLNSETRVEIDYTKSQRRVQLIRGEAYFEVTHNPARPFVVTAGGTRVTALGTTFVVRYDTDKTAVTLVEGKVVVLPVAGDELPVMPPTNVGQSRPPARKDLVLTPGERLTLARNTPALVDEPRVEAVTAWRRGEVVLDKTQLSEAIAEMNRYDSQTLVIEDPRVATLQVSGIYHAGDSESFARSVAKLYGLHVQERPGQIVLR
jgi:transmembrane sensor